MPALGERFRAAREARGLSLSDVSEQIRIRSVYLAAIEEENWKAIGAPVYVRGFLRTYARFLGLDPEEIIAAFNGAPAAPAAPAAKTSAPSYATATYQELEEPPQRAGRGSLLIWAAGLIAVLLVAFVVYNELTWHNASVASSTNTTNIAPDVSPSPAASESPAASASPAVLALAATPCPSPAPTPTGSALPGGAHPTPTPCVETTPSPIAVGTDTPGFNCPPSGQVVPGDTYDSTARHCPAWALSMAGPHSLTLVLSAPSWMRVTVDGTVRMEGTFPAGTSKSFNGKTALVRVGNAGGVEIFVSGKDVGKLGKAGDVAEKTFAL